MSCGTRDGLPIGLMIVGRHFDEETVYALPSPTNSATVSDERQGRSGSGVEVPRHGLGGLA